MDRILYNKGVGIGDWLRLSTLPELFSKQGSDVFIYNNIKETNLSKDVVDLIMMNPYIKGFSNSSYNCGDLDEFLFDDTIWDNYNSMQIKEYQNKVEITDGVPIIYYQPNFRKEFSDKLVVDINCNTEKNNYILDYYNKFDGVYLNSKIDVPENYITKDIFEYIDIIYSCKEFRCLFSGGSFIASAIKRFRVDLEVNCYMPDVYYPGIYDMDFYKFRLPNINYNKLEPFMVRGKVG